VPGALRIYGDKKSLPAVISPQLTGWYWLPSDLSATKALMIDYEPSDIGWMCSSATLVGHLTVTYGVQGLEQAPSHVLRGKKPQSSKTGASSATSPKAGCVLAHTASTHVPGRKDDERYGDYHQLSPATSAQPSCIR
jgi:hypothetical protein